MFVDRFLFEEGQLYCFFKLCHLSMYRKSVTEAIRPHRCGWVHVTTTSRNVRKRTFGHVCPAKIHISLRIRTVWSESSLGALCWQWRLWSDCADAQADWRLRWVPVLTFRLVCWCPRSLIGISVVCKKRLCILGYPKGVQRRFWSDCANASAKATHIFQQKYQRIRHI